MRRLFFAFAGAIAFIACGSAGDGSAGSNTTTITGTGAGGSASSTSDNSSPSSSTSSSASSSTSSSTGGGGSGGGPTDGGPPPVDTLTSNRDRLLATYFAYLKQFANTPQSNGLSGANVTDVCDVWKKLDPSSQAVFLTLTARMQGSILAVDGTSMLWHIVKLYRLVGGQGATAADPGSCGGGEYNRMIMSMDATLHDSQVAANAHQGAKQNGKYDISDIPATSYWRDSHDLGGSHAPFDASDETNQGAPRGQTQYFSDPKSALANTALGRLDLMTLVDPYAIEMDQDYDCVHASNPLCEYITYGVGCFPETQALGTDIYTQSYGSFDPGWMPAGCAP